MATHRRKVVEVHARQWDGLGTMAVYHKVKGNQSARKGDWLVGPDDAQHGDIEVIKKEDFERDFEPIGVHERVDTHVDCPDCAQQEQVQQTAHLGNADGELPVADEPTSNPQE